MTVSKSESQISTLKDLVDIEVMYSVLLESNVYNSGRMSVCYRLNDRIEKKMTISHSQF